MNQQGSTDQPGWTQLLMRCKCIPFLISILFLILLRVYSTNRKLRRMWHITVNPITIINAAKQPLFVLLTIKVLRSWRSHRSNKPNGNCGFYDKQFCQIWQKRKVISRNVESLYLTNKNYWQWSTFVRMQIRHLLTCTYKSRELMFSFISDRKPYLE